MAFKEHGVSQAVYNQSFRFQSMQMMSNGLKETFDLPHSS